MSHRNRVLAAAAGVVAALTAVTVPAAAQPAHRPPARIDLPAGFQPEGLSVGPGPYAYTGSLADGSIYRVDLRTGRGAVFSAGPGTPSTGLESDGRRLFVAGGPGGDARVLDQHSGAVLATYKLATGSSFVNDAVVTPDAVWFTDSVNPVLYRLPLGRHGALPAQSAVRAVPITGDLVYGEGFNANGITRTPDGRGLLVDQTSTGKLFRIDPATGASRAVDLGGVLLPDADGLLLRGHDLFVVRNNAGELVRVRLDGAGRHGRVAHRTTDAQFAVPTAVGVALGRAYLVNARFDVTPTATTPYSIVAVPLS